VLRLTHFRSELSLNERITAPGIINDFATNRHTADLQKHLRFCLLSGDTQTRGAPLFHDAIRYCALHAIIASGRVRLATEGGAKIAR